MAECATVLSNSTAQPQQTPDLSDFLPVRVQVVAFFFQLLLQVFDLLLPPVVLLHHLEIHDNFKKQTNIKTCERSTKASALA